MTRARQLALFGIPVLLLVSAVLFGMYCWPPKASGDVASWVQAFGSLLGLGVAIGVAVWERAIDRQSRIEAEGRAESARAVYVQQTRLAVGTFIGVMTSSMESIEEVLKRNPSRHDVLLRGAVISEMMDIGRGIDMGALNVVDATTVLAARSVCSQVDLLMQEERRSLASPQCADLYRYMPHFVERAKEIERAWLEGRVVGPAQ